MSATIIEQLFGVLPAACIRRNVFLRDYTSMRVGGPADIFIEPETDEQVELVCHFARAHSIPLLLLGNGSNTLVSDDGFRGIVLHIGSRMSAISCDGCVITAQAGALLSTVARIAAEHGMTGFECLAGIPGSIGGAVCMNAGAYGGEMKDVIVSARVLADGAIKTLALPELELGYRHSAVMEHGWTVLSVRFQVKKGDPAQIRAAMADYAARRREKQPLQYPSCGSFFKRPSGHFAGALIQDSHLKGYSIGGAQVSELHAGFIINKGGATAQDIYRLMRHVQNTVLADSGVELQPEVRLIGRFDP